MAQLATVLMSTYLVAADGGPRRATTIFDGATGVEQRNQVWFNGRHFWNLTWGGTLTDLQPVLDLFDEAEGRFYSFLFTPPGYTEMDFRFDADEPRLALQASAEPGEFIATITLPVIEVLDE